MKTHQKIHQPTPTANDLSILVLTRESRNNAVVISPIRADMLWKPAPGMHFVVEACLPDRVSSLIDGPVAGQVSIHRPPRPDKAAPSKGTTMRGILQIHEHLVRLSASRRHASLVFVLALGLSIALGTGSARAETLRWKFKAGDKLPYTMDQKTVTTMKVMGQELKTVLTQTINLHWDIKSVNADGSAEVVQTIDRFRTAIESPFVPFKFDSNDKKDPDGPVAGVMVPLLRSMVGAEFSMKMSATGELSDVKIPEKLLNSIKNAGPGGGPSGGMFSEDGLKTMLAQSSLSFPNESIDKGKGWTRQSKIPTPPIGTMILDKGYTYQGPSAKDPSIVTIDLTTKVTIDAQPDPNLSIKVSSQEGKGSFLFNTATGHMELSSVKDKMVMTLTAMNQVVDQITETETSMKLDK